MKGQIEKPKDVLNRLVSAIIANKELKEIQHSFDTEEESSMKPYYKFMISWLVLFAVGTISLYIANVGNALEIAMILSFIVALYVPIKSYGFLIIITGVLLSAFQQFVGINCSIILCSRNI